MKLILQDKNKYILRGERGDNLLEELKRFCEKQKIAAGVLHAIGAVKDVEIGWYNLREKRYETKVFESAEIDILFGTIATLDDKVVIHSHGVFSDRNMATQGGDIKKLIVSATCEVLLEKLEGKIEKEYSKEIGLNLMK